MGIDLNEAFLRQLGLAKRAGRAELGEDGVSGAAAAGKARLVLLASDAAENTARRARNLTEGTHAVVLTVPYSKDVLGAACGRASCAMLAITESGLARSAAEKLSAANGGAFDEAVQALREMDDRIRARRGKKHPRKSES